MLTSIAAAFAFQGTPSFLEAAPTCGAWNAQCDGKGNSTIKPLKCCDGISKCETVNEYYSKCVMQPKCSSAGAQCSGTGDNTMEATPCCDEGFHCKSLSATYGMCVNATKPDPGVWAKCAIANAQCKGAGNSTMKEAHCCDSMAKCETVNEYYSKCVYQPACVSAGAKCKGAGDSVMEETRREYDLTLDRC
tara:strand:- start:9 stop:581 length:573 start_codon:yes stop_codon:yes gene_type:complete